MLRLGTKVWKYTSIFSSYKGSKHLLKCGMVSDGIFRSYKSGDILLKFCCHSSVTFVNSM